MISMARTFGAPDTVPAGSVARSTSMALLPSRSVPDTCDVMCITWLYRSRVIISSTRHGAELDDAAHVVAGQVDQHDVLGDLLRVLDELGRHAPVLLVGATAAARAGDRP